MAMVNPELIELREKYDQLSERVARVEGRTSDVTKQTIWQFVIFMVGIAGLVIGLVNYQNSVLEKRFDEINKRIEQGNSDLGARLERVERNLDDLNKELRSQRK
jgi:tetrahydromethanopterin S-methyltransferase subunit G